MADDEISPAVRFLQQSEDAIPSAEDFGFLHQIDAFNKNIKQAVTALQEFWPARFVQLLLQAHVHRLMPELQLVNQLALDADDSTGGKRRREIAERLVAAGVLTGTRLERLRKWLSDARRDRDLGDFDADGEGMGDLPDDWDGVFDAETEARIQEAQKLQQADDEIASIAIAKLVQLGVFSADGARLIMAADLCSHGVAPSAVRTDGVAPSVLKTDG